jgi:hypothetical protein
VYFVSAYWGDAAETVTVLGLARRPKRWITVDVRARVLESWRAKLTYQPGVLRKLPPNGPADELEARELASTLRYTSADARLRLIETTAAGAHDAASRLEAGGSVVLRAGLPPPKAGGEPVGFVLHDGAAPIAGGTVFGADGGRRWWRAIWVAGDRHDALAELLVAVQGRYPETALWSMGRLLTMLRLARGEAGSASPLASGGGARVAGSTRRRPRRP